MKTKFVRNTQTDRRELVVIVQRGERLDEKRAKVLAKDPSQLLLPFSYENTRVGTLLHYDVEGLWSLKTFLAKKRLGTDELMGLFQAVLGVLDLCAEQRLQPEGLFFDPEFVFVNAQCCPRFVLLTLEEMPLQERNSALTLLRAISDVAHLHFSSPDAEGIAKRLAAYIVEQDGVFSANTFRRHVESEERALGMAEGEDEEDFGAAEPSTSSTWATAGAGASASAADDSALFWNPLMGIAVEEELAPAVPVEQPPMAAQSAVASAVQTPVVEQSATLDQRGYSPNADAGTAGQRGYSPSAQQNAAATPSDAGVRGVSPLVAPTPARSAWLVRVSTGEQYPLVLGAQLKLGRGSACDIRLLGNPRLSRVHAAVSCDGSQVQVTDLGAANGVWVGGIKLASNQTMATSVGQTFRLANEDVYVRIG